MSLKFSREKFSELVNKISLVLTQDVETEPSDVRLGMIFANLLGYNEIQHREKKLFRRRN